MPACLVLTVTPGQKNHLSMALILKPSLLLTMSNIIMSRQCPRAKESFCTRKLSTAIVDKCPCISMPGTSGGTGLSELCKALSYRWNLTLLWEMLDHLGNVLTEETKWGRCCHDPQSLEGPFPKGPPILQYIVIEQIYSQLS